jgi:lipid-A-disaccharide synthase
MELDVLLVRAPGLHATGIKIPSYIQQITAERYAAMAQCDFLIVASGTSTLEAAILKVPFVIVYKVGKISWLLGKVLVRVPYYGLVNWIAEKKIVSEFIQQDMNPAALAQHCFTGLTNEDTREKMKKDLNQIVETLGPSGAIRRATDAILALI